MIRVILFIISLSIGSLISFGQTSVFAITNDGSIIRINPGNCSYEIMVPGSQINQSFTDIAYDNGELYVCNNKIFRIDLFSGSAVSTNIGSINDSPLNGLTSDLNGNFYASGGKLSKVILSTGSIGNLGFLDNYYTAGDLEIHNEAFYIAAIDSVGSTKLIRVQTNPFMISEIGLLPDAVYGMTKHSSLNADEVFISSFSNLLVLNLNTTVTSVICPQIWPGMSIYGLTSGPEYLNIQLQANSSEINIVQQEKQVTIHIENTQLDQFIYEIQNTLGQIIVSSGISSQNTSINLSNFVKGIYFLTIIKSNQPILQKKLISF
ncbi:T9SS type A sorting domain-containing protein [uncultured Fluviicola sp.]|uniref:T9SS type A sorting domain-containing protein n=1 Tax=uncultured Fluviicola sp. TaxID=463303 RepID=UPI0025D19668|nr:T9SS type A sorting domain-containing protein [uncultured Fluviicola sp.]